MRREVGMQIRMARERLGMSREELAAKVGCSAVSIWKWETGRTLPLPAFRKRLERLLGIKIPDKRKN